MIKENIAQTQGWGGGAIMDLETGARPRRRPAGGGVRPRFALGGERWRGDQAGQLQR